ncbi:hypothetical protein [Allocoleopsis sp.]|uniref:hypothetical protein n=1 Tax=Allocoleopsis sp. TaxID=3088169 RepID=UPI002FCF071C
MPVSTDFRFWMQGFWGYRDTGGRGREQNTSVQNQSAKIEIGSSTASLLFNLGGNHEPKSEFCHP